MRPFNKVAQREKLVRKLQRESHQLYAAKLNLGYVYLEKPIRHGWHKHLILREDVSRRVDANVFLEILDICGTECWGRDKRHADKVWDRESKKIHEIQFPGFQRVNSISYAKLSRKAKTWFILYGSCWHYRHGYLKQYQCVVPRHFFKLAYTRAYITKRMIVDSMLDKRLAEIESELRSNMLYKHSENAGYGKWWMTDQYHRKVRRRTKVALLQYDEARFDQMIYRDYNW